MAAFPSLEPRVRPGDHMPRDFEAVFWKREKLLSGISHAKRTSKPRMPLNVTGECGGKQVGEPIVPDVKTLGSNTG